MAIKATELSTECPSDESPDWGHARTRRMLLRRPDCELSLSLNSVPFDGFTAPNRDYPDEGLTAVVNGRNWKFLDALAFSLNTATGPLALEPEKVALSPHKAAYRYSSPVGPLTVEYYLFRKHSHPLMCASFQCPEKTALRVRPIVDMRPASSAERNPPIVKVDEKQLSAHAAGMQMSVYSQQTTAVARFSRPQHWKYKLGSGNRKEDGALVFVTEERVPECIGELAIAPKKGRADVFVACGKSNGGLDAFGLPKHDEKLELARTSRILSANSKALAAAEARWGKAHARALAIRLVSLLEKFQFGTGTDAGAMWFRQEWLRDSFEAMLANFRLSYAEGKRDARRTIMNALSFEKDGLVPTRLAPEPRYDSLDTTLLCLHCAIEYLKLDDDPALAAAAQKAFRHFEAAGLRGKEFSLSNGLVACRADWSWTDSARSADGVRVPLRLPEEWVARAYQEGKPGYLAGPNFMLAETNALWVSLLQKIPESWGAATSGADAAKEFKRVFWDGHGIAHAHCDEFGTAHDPSSHAVEAAALLPNLLSKDELSALRSWIDPLLVRRGGKLFGILCRRTGRPYFLGDDEYHRCTLWPRETPYLIKLLSRLGDHKAAEELLLSNLEHQEDEGAVHYCHELFSLPNGVNPSPSQTSSLPVPVKNPAQQWSEWVQPYLDFLSGEKQGF